MYQTDIFSSLEKTLVVLGVCTVFSLVVFLFLKVVEGVGTKRIEGIGQLCLVAFVFGLLAAVTGIITAASRSSAVGDVLPAALGFIGAVALYVITKQKSEIPVAATAVTAFSAMLLFGTVLGSYERVRAVAYQSAQEYNFERLKTQADIEFVINSYRKSRGLDPISLADR